MRGRYLKKAGLQFESLEKPWMSQLGDIDEHPRGRLLQKFLLKGPYYDTGKVPSSLSANYLSDSETAEAIDFIYSFMVNTFKGSIAELLASGACSNLIERLKNDGHLPTNAKLYIGDSIKVVDRQAASYRKGADSHVISKGRLKNGNDTIAVVGVTEVKSYIPSQKRLCLQIDQHLRRPATECELAAKCIRLTKSTLVLAKGPARYA